MSEDTLPTAADLLDLPEDCVPEHGITILSYIDGDGHRSYGWVVHGTPVLDETIGLMAVAQIRLIQTADEEDDED